jgi:glycosyltransferase involved in cell wall biosynthesis
LRLVYVGRLVASKGLFGIVEALTLLKAQGRGYTFKIAGGGPDEVRMREAAGRAGLEDRITFLGSVFGEAKNRLWLGSDVFSVPRWHKEGLPYSILEAMAAWRVPVTCSVTAIADVMQDGVHGVFVPSKDPEALAHAVARLDEGRRALSRMAEGAQTRE